MIEQVNRDFLSWQVFVYLFMGDIIRTKKIHFWYFHPVLPEMVFINMKIKKTLLGGESFYRKSKIT
jgi:hypothetical protein